MSLLHKPSKLAACSVVFSFFTASTLAFAQDATPPPEEQQQSAPAPSHGWPRAQQQNPYQTAQVDPNSNQPADANQAPPPPATDQTPAAEQPPYANQPPAANQPPYANPSPYGQPAGNQPYGQPPANLPYGQSAGNQPVYGQGPYNQGPYNQGPYNQGPYNNAPYGPPQNGNYGPNPYTAPPPIPAQVTITPGTYLTVRVNQVLSSEHNHKGDAFSATLVQPVVANGLVVAEPGQTLGGQVAESQESGRVKGTAKLGVVLTDLTLVDGQRLPIQTELIARNAHSTVGRDAGAIAGTTALGAAVGAAANWGTGAAVGAGAGLLLGTLGVLVTKGAPSVIYPEQVLTFRLGTPATFSTSLAPQAFHWVQPGEYDRPVYNQEPRPRVAYAGAPLYAPYPYPYYYSPFWYGPSVGFWFGPSYYHRGYYGGFGYGGYHHFRR